MAVNLDRDYERVSRAILSVGDVVYDPTHGAVLRITQTWTGDCRDSGSGHAHGRPCPRVGMRWSALAEPANAAARRKLGTGPVTLCACLSWEAAQETHSAWRRRASRPARPGQTP